MPYRASLRHDSGPFSPRTSGNAASAGSRRSSKASSAVTEARSESLRWILWALKPFASVGTANPRIPSSVWAQTTATSARVPLVIHILEPLRTQSLPVLGCARVFIEPGSAAGVGLGEAEAADRLAGGHPRQPLLLLLVAAPAVDRVHRQRPLHADEAAQPGVDGLELAAGHAVRRGAGAGAAVALEVHAEQAELAEHRPEVVGQRALVVPLGDVGRELAPGEVAHRVADRAVLVGEQVVDPQEVVRCKSGSSSCPFRGSLGVERGVELRVVVGGHQQRLGHRVELHRRPERHVELAGDQATWSAAAPSVGPSARRRGEGRARRRRGRRSSRAG